MPADTVGELQSRLTDLTAAVSSLTGHLRPGPDESAAAADGDTEDIAAFENFRFARAMGDIHMAVESATKTTHIAHIATLGTTPVYSHDIRELLRGQPERVRNGFTALADGSDVDLSDLGVWRQGATCSADRPVIRFNEDMLRAHTAAALG